MGESEMSMALSQVADSVESSAMSSIGGTSTSSQDDQEERRRKIMFIVAAACALLFISGLTLFLVLQSGQGTGNDPAEEETPAIQKYISDNSATATSTIMVPSNATNTATTTTAATTTTTSTLKPPLPGKFLACVSSLDQAIFQEIDGLCYFMFYTVQDINQLKNKNLGLSKSKIGVDIPSSRVQANQAKLANSIATYWPTIREFAVLDLELRPGVSTYVDDVITFLKEADTSLNTHIRAEPPPRMMFGYVLLGVAVILQGQPPSTLMTNFNKLVQEVQPDALLYRTSLNRNVTDPGICRRTGPAPWKGQGMPSVQSSFLDSLRFRRAPGFQPLPLKTAELLSVSAAATKTAYKSPDRTRPGDAPCENVTQINPKDVVCKGGPLYKIIKNQFKILFTDPIHYDKWGSTFEYDININMDTNCTMVIKMCLAYNNFNFTGGYVIFDVHIHYLCKKPPFFVEPKGDFGLVKWATSTIYEDYTGVECTNINC